MIKDEFYRTWLAHFADGISKEDLERYVIATGNLIWHVFSWELLNEKKYLKGPEAKAAYDKIDKGGAMYIEWFRDEATLGLPQELHTAKALDNMTEVYVVASDFSWTYIKTHEDMCGPYFMQL